MQKGSNVSLTKLLEAAGAQLSSVVVACGWSVNDGCGEDYDLDMSAAAIDDSGKVPSDKDPNDKKQQAWFFYPNHRDLASKCICFKHDNRTGEGEGDNEEISVNLGKVPEHIKKIVFSVVIWNALRKGGQKFGDIKNAYIRIYDEESGKELARFDLTEFSDETLVMFGELYLRNGEWKFRAVGQGYDAAKYREEFGIQHPFETESARPFYRMFS